MGALLDVDPSLTLEAAYQQALRTDDSIYSTLIATEVKAAEEKRIAEQKALSERARNAAVSVTGAPGGAKPLSNGRYGSDNIEDDVRAAASEVRGRV